MLKLSTLQVYKYLYYTLSQYQILISQHRHLYWSFVIKPSNWCCHQTTNKQNNLPKLNIGHVALLTVGYISMGVLRKLNFESKNIQLVSQSIHIVFIQRNRWRLRQSELS